MRLIGKLAHYKRLCAELVPRRLIAPLWQIPYKFLLTSVKLPPTRSTPKAYLSFLRSTQAIFTNSSELRVPGYILG